MPKIRRHPYPAEPSHYSPTAASVEVLLPAVGHRPKRDVRTRLRCYYSNNITRIVIITYSVCGWDRRRPFSAQYFSIVYI